MQAWLLLALSVLGFAPVQQSITLEVRTFDGTADVSDATRVVVHRAAQRDQPVGQVNPGARPTITVPPGIYDAQAVREQAGRHANIRWAERLVVMPYPDENGHHLEVINFQSGYGALEVRGTTGRASEADVALYPTSDHAKPAAAPLTTSTYALFVVRAGEDRCPRQARRARHLASTRQRAARTHPAVDRAVSRGFGSRARGSGIQSRTREPASREPATLIRLVSR